MTKLYYSLFSAALLLLLPAELPAQRLYQPLSRGVVAVNRSGSSIRSVTSSGGIGNLISWRKLAQEPEGTTYNVYRRGRGATEFQKMNSTPLKVTNYAPSSLTSGTEYAVTAISPDGVEGPMSAPFTYTSQPYPNVWFNFDFDNKVIARNDYRTKFVWPMDIDGDGEYDAVVCDRLYTGANAGEKEDDAESQSDNTATTSHKLQAYKFDGTLLWTVDMGPNVNISSGQNDMVVAWDINCDGRCEVMIKASDGTRFWDKANNTWGKYAKGSSSADTDGDGVVDYRSHSTRVPPFYVSVIDGETGAEIDCNELKYSEVHDGSDTWGRNTRAKYMSFGYAVMDGHFAICYLDGIHPSLVMECLDRDNNKSHHNYVFSWEYDWTGGTPTNWHHDKTWSRNDKSPWPAEFHQLRVADVDGDGTDEMIQGGYSVNPKNGWFRSPGIGHGDRFILSDIDPDRPGLEVYAIQQSALLGQLLYDAATAERIKEWYLPSVYDVGRGACLDIDASRKGYEILSYTDEFIYDCKGEKTGQTRSGSMFEGVWWDGRLQREWLNSPGGSGWGTNLMITRVLGDRLCEFSQESSWATHGATGTRPAFMGDIIGDWREEIILAKQNAESCTGLVGYTTNIPTSYSIYCLQQDPHYRGDCTTRGYYQHPNTGFYLGGGMSMPPLPPVYESDLRYKGNGQYSTFDMTADAPYAEGKSVLFDLSGDNSVAVAPSSPLQPSMLYLMNPRGHDYLFQGDVTAGKGGLIKSMQGTATVNGTLGHTGKTIISEGTLEVNGTIAGPVELRARGTLGGRFTLQDTITFEGALNYEGCRLKAGGDVISSEKSMVLPGEVYLEIDAVMPQPGNPLSGYLQVEGDLTFRGTNYVTVNLGSKDFAEYEIARCTGTLTCDVTKLNTRGLEGINYDLEVRDNRLLLIIHDSRLAADGVVWTGALSNVWDYKKQNFSFNGSTPTAFVSGDGVVFNDHAASTNVSVPEMMVTKGVSFDSGTYTLSGDGGLSGEGGLTVNPAAKVTLNNKYSDYTGPTIVNGGTLTVPNFYDGGQRSALGAATSAQGNLQIKNGGILELSRDNMGTDRQITVTDTATIRIAQQNSALSLKGKVGGTGYLIKDGAGQLNFTYGGANDFAGLIVKRGIVAQGAWNSTFGRSGSPMVLAGGEVHQIDVNSTSTVPTFNHAVTVQEGTTNRILGSSRGKINGSLKGKGNLTVETRYVRCDVGLNLSAFEGTLNAKGSQFRLMTNVNDLSKGRLKVDADTWIAFFNAGSGNEASGTLKIGAIEGTSATGSLGGGSSSYEIGYLNTDMSYSGLFTANSITKVGTGKLTLRTAGHTSPITISGGSLELASAATTTGVITVGRGARLYGSGKAANITVSRDGTLYGGTETVPTGVLRADNITLTTGATLVVRLGATSGNSRLTVSGRIIHTSDTLLVSIPEGRRLSEGDELTVFSSGFTSATGNPLVKTVAADGAEYTWDASTLNTDGKIRLIGVVTPVSRLAMSDVPVDVFTTDGILLRSRVPARRALDGLQHGVYVVDGRKVMK